MTQSDNGFQDLLSLSPATYFKYCFKILGGKTVFITAFQNEICLSFGQSLSYSINLYFGLLIIVKSKKQRGVRWSFNFCLPVCGLPLSQL